MGKYDDVFAQSINDPEGFWAEAAKDIDWYTEAEKVLDDTNPPFYRWFRGGELNACYNALDRHVENGRGDQVAIIWDSPVTDTKEQITYSELLKRVTLFAGALKGQGVEKGDTAIIYMPMIPEAAVAMLACARIGAVHSVVFGGFAANELAVRIDHAQPKVIVCASGAIEGKKVLSYKPLVDKAIETATHKPEKCIVFQRPEVTAELDKEYDRDWSELVSKAEPADCVKVQATDPHYILYTSGTTGMPKGVLRDTGGHCVALRWTMTNVYDVQPGDVYWAASDVGWVVGHSYIIYAPLLTGCTTIIYEGKPVGTPDPGAFWRVINEYGVKVLFTAPTAFRAIKREDPNGDYLKKYDLSCFKYLFLAGERLDSDTYHWANNLLERPVVDHWWQTETGWPIVSNCLGIEPFDLKAGSPTKPVPGYDVQILDDGGHPVEAGKEGNVVVKLPLPPGTLATLWRDDPKFEKSYMSGFPGYYETSDGGYQDEEGYIFIMGRMDDVINIAGHRLSTGAMEEVISKHQAVAECAVIGVHDALKGQSPIGLVVLKGGVEQDSDELKGELVQMVRAQIGPIACYKETLIVNSLPKTRSGKILRATMRSIANGKEYRMPSTIMDASVLDDITDTFHQVGLPR